MHHVAMTVMRMVRKDFIHAIQNMLLVHGHDCGTGVLTGPIEAQQLALLPDA